MTGFALKILDSPTPEQPEAEERAYFNYHVEIGESSMISSPKMVERTQTLLCGREGVVLLNVELETLR
jgi:hypothetical protein